ncbi:hypothetical protein QAD02_019626 [Eretmocerus hayati]|uniref:Uncharacterized protein n=1 Tax=Eretmocerus hayati TaxID=131215 RepID=A0ACC2PKN4_9HYME|nr:hypothetical protein QAD02_019626 [Eretmocerus hayati]
MVPTIYSEVPEHNLQYKGPAIGYNSLRIAVMHGDALLARVILSSDQLPLGWDDGYECLMLAIESNHHEVALILLERVTRVNPTVLRSTSPLHLASRDSNPNLVNILLSKGAMINSVDENLMTPLHHAVVFENYPIVELLLSKGAEPYLISRDTYFEFTPFEHACKSFHPEILKLFLDVGCNPSSNFVHQGKPSSPLRMALTSGNASAVKLLLDRGAQEMVEDQDESLLHLACRAQEALEMVKLLLESASRFLSQINRKYGAGFTPLRIAVKEARLDLVELLLKNGADPEIADKEGKVPLELAVEDRLWDVVDCLLSHLSIDRRDRGEKAFRLAVLEHGVMSEAYKIFVKHGYRITAEILADVTFAAIEKGYFQTVETMIGLAKERQKIYGMEPCSDLLESLFGATNSKGMSLGHCAAKFRRLDILRLLIREDGGESAFSLDGEGKSALSYAIENKDVAIIKALMVDKSKKYSVSLLPILDDLPLLNLALHLGANVNHRHPVSKITALHSACQNPNPSDHTLIELLLLNGADVNSVTSDGSSALHLTISAFKNHKMSLRPVLQILLHHGAKVNSRDRLGRTPMHLAALQGNSIAIDVLLEYSADLNIEAIDGSTALSVALKLYKDEIGCNFECFGQESTTTEISNSVEMLVRHVVKLKVAKLKVNGKNDELVKKIFEMKQFRMECAEEIGIMRRAKILGGSVTLLHVLRRKSRRLYKYLEKPDRQLREKLEDNSIGMAFPLYGSLLEAAAKMILQDLMMIDAKRALAFLTSFEPPDLCCETIFQHLDTRDLKNLHIASTSGL